MSIIRINHLTFTYPGSYTPVFENVTFQIDTDWRLGFTGRNGRGKTTFLRLLMGQYAYSGTISASVPFEQFPFVIREEQDITMDIIYTIVPEAEDWQIYRELSLLDLSDTVLYRPFATLSFGEQTKVRLAALFLKEHHFLLMDEPTNHLDATARKKLAEYLRSKHGFLLISHDRGFLDSCVDHILAINRTNLEVRQGNFSSWRENKQRQDQFELAQDEKLQRDIGHLQAARKRTGAWSDSVERSKFGTTSSGSKLDRGYVRHKAAKMAQRAEKERAVGSQPLPTGSFVCMG